MCISGSAKEKSANAELLFAIQKLHQDAHEFDIYQGLRDLPLFRPEDLGGNIHPSVMEFKSKIQASEAIIISTPEYTHNIPAVLKNGLEWITASGELADKKILPITFTPTEPRGAYAMQSLLFSLKTMKANIITQLPIYKTEVEFTEEGISIQNETKIVIEEALKLLQ